MRTDVMKQPMVRAHARFLAAVLALAAPSIALADETVVSVQVPPGGATQFKVAPIVPNDPTPIIIDQIGPGYGVTGVTYLGAPEAAGTALTDGGSVVIRTASASASASSSDPVIGVIVAVSDQAPAGTTVNLTLASSATDSGSSAPNVVNQVDSVVNGAVSITDVQPGGGLLPAGSLVAVVGGGFQPDAQVLIDGASPASTSWVDSSRVEVVTAVDTQLDGKLVTVTNPDSSGAAFFSSLHTTDLGTSATPLLAATEAIFPLQTRSSAVFALPTNGTFFALALQNPGSVDSSVSIELVDDAGLVLGSTALALPPLTRVSRAIPELFPEVIPGAGSVFRLTATVPVQMLGLSGNESDGSVTPVLPALPAP